MNEHVKIVSSRQLASAPLDQAKAIARIPVWSWISPLLALAILVAVPFVGSGAGFTLLAGVGLVVTVFAAVYHAEVVARWTGEPLGTLVLAVAVTVIEVALIVSMMIAAPAAGLARDTVFSAVMIACNGIVGLSLLWGGARYHEQRFKVHGASAALAVLAALTTLTFVLPNLARTAPGPLFSTSQLIFIASICLVLYGVFIFVQTVRHRQYFQPVEDDVVQLHAPAPSRRSALISGGLLLAALVTVVGLAKSFTPGIESALTWLNLPKTVAGIVIAMLVQLPEGLAALRAAWANRLQASLNLALGSALASIGLTIPAIAAVAVVLRQPLELGLDQKDQMLLAVTLFAGVITLGSGRTTVLQGAVHLVIFVVFLFFAVVP